MTLRTNLREFSGLVAGLRDRLTGPVFLPGERGYAEECSTYNLMTPLRPYLTVGAETVADVQATVRFAAQHGIGVAIRGGGHVVAKQAEDIVVINMRRMRSVTWTPMRAASGLRAAFSGRKCWTRSRPSAWLP